jgi:hypothetical protein
MKRTAAKGGMLVNRASDNLLPGSRFPKQQDRRAASPNHPRARHHRGQTGVGANQSVLAGARGHGRPAAIGVLL